MSTKSRLRILVGIVIIVVVFLIPQCSGHQRGLKVAFDA